MESSVVVGLVIFFIFICLVFVGGMFIFPEIFGVSRDEKSEGDDKDI